MVAYMYTGVAEVAGGAREERTEPREALKSVFEVSEVSEIAEIFLFSFCFGCFYFDTELSECIESGSCAQPLRRYGPYPTLACL